MGVQQFVNQKVGEDVKTYTANPASIPPEARQKRAAQARHWISPKSASDSHDGGNVNMPANTVAMKLDRNGEQAITGNIPHQHGIFDETEISSVGDTTTTSQGQHPDDDDLAVDDDFRGAEPDGFHEQAPTAQRDGQGAAVTLHHIQRNLIRHVGEISGNHGPMDYPATSPTDPDFDQSAPKGDRRQGHFDGKHNVNNRPIIKNTGRPLEPQGFRDASRPNHQEQPAFFKPLHAPSGQRDAPWPDAGHDVNVHAANGTLPSHSNNLPQRGVRAGVAEDDSHPPLNTGPAPQKRPLESDYSEEQLKKKTYTDLKNEPFERTALDEDVSLPKKFKQASLREKLEHLRSLPEESEDVFEKQSRFFALLPLVEHDECGDIILAQFQDLLGRVRQLRRDKRDAALVFEAEIEKRVNAVQEQSGALERELAQLKSKGQDVVKRRT